MDEGWRGLVMARDLSRDLVSRQQGPERRARTFRCTGWPRPNVKDVRTRCFSMCMYRTRE
jgi:hypothetical protein